MPPEPGTALELMPDQDSVTEIETPSEDGGGFFSDTEFQERVSVVMNALRPENDPDGEKYRRCLAEIHTYLSLFDRGIRQMQTDVTAAGGPFAMMRGLFGMMKGN